ncbi:flagellar biosynthesis protein [Novosphingobium flavum]|uniref:Flagellar assembly protein FliH n=1 Tax=Novosphingobium flavum TaxID=1778672 RepID=A0A7X1KM29_9SPHN|nr:FliH/SctL family protein [Novosphingobium flavum]MBC2665953.1 flagellar biosynthesis protein [Novosphingobium flavum]
MSSLLALTSGRGGNGPGFRHDARFALVPAPADPAPAPTQIEDPVAIAWAEGYAHGSTQGRAEAEAAHAAESGARAALELALSKMDAEMAESLRQRLLDTVMALCEAALVPYAHDADVLAARIERAVAMFSRAEDERVIRLHPDDLALISEKLAADWKVVPDPALERGALRVETQTGGVEDGPAEWRRALSEAFHSC